MKNKVVLFLILLFNFCVAQRFSNLSSYEKRWSFTHPFAALKMKKIYKKSWGVYQNMKQNKEPDSFESGGKLDAYRHILFMAAFCQKIRPKKVRKLGKAHEKGNYSMFLKKQSELNERPDSLSTVMDLYNNEVGIKLGCDNKKMGIEDLSKLVVSEIKNGKALYFKRNSNGEYLNCVGEIISFSNYINKWYVPKCLITSDK